MPGGRDATRGGRNTRSGSAQARSTVTGVLGLQVLANGLGLAVVAAYLRFLLPLPTDRRSEELNLLVFGVYLGLMVLVALPVNMLLLRRAVTWVRQGQAPTARQRALVLRLPLYETLSAFVSWVGAAVLFSAVNEGARRISLGILLAGLVVSTFLYLLLEGHFRPVFALALEGADLPEGRRDVLPRLMLAWLLGSGLPLVALGLSTLAETEFAAGSRPAWLAAAGVVGGGLVMGAAAVSVARPLNRVRAALRRVERGELDVHLPVDDLGELGRLSEGVNDLVAGLREREELRDLFSRQVGQVELVAMAADGQGVGTAQRRDVTVLFVDLSGYTRFAERHQPEEVLAMLNRFFRVVVAVVNREGGWINKFEGDAAMCLFGAPQDQADHAARALRAARDIPVECSWEPGILPVGVGVATGEAVAGFVGTAERFEYTVIGDVVNLAARLCELAKEEPTGVLASMVTVRSAGHPEGWARPRSVRVRGRRERAEVVSMTPPHARRGRGRRR